MEMILVKFRKIKGKSLLLLSFGFLLLFIANKEAHALTYYQCNSCRCETYYYAKQGSETSIKPKHNECPKDLKASITTSNWCYTKSGLIFTKYQIYEKKCGTKKYDTGEFYNSATNASIEPSSSNSYRCNQCTSKYVTECSKLPKYSESICKQNGCDYSNYACVDKVGTGTTSPAPKVTIFAPTAGQQFAAGTTTTDLKVTTDIKSSCYAAENTTNSSAGQKGRAMTAASDGKTHTVTLTGLVAGSNTRAVTCTANGVKASATVSFTVNSSTPSNPGGSGGNDSGSQTTTTYTITFHSNGGSSVASQSIAKNGKVSKPADPTRSGYTFQGWFTDANSLNNAYDFNKSVTAKVDLYAKWLAVVDTSTTIKDECIGNKKDSQGKCIGEYRWAQPNAYFSGLTGACGDAVLVTNCETLAKSSDPKCEVTAINGSPINVPSSVHRLKLGTAFPVACGKIIRYASNAAAYFTTSSISGEAKKLECNTELTLDGSAINACQYGDKIAEDILVEGKTYKVGKYCKATTSSGETIYVDRGGMMIGKPVCTPTEEPSNNEGRTCESSAPQNNVAKKEEVTLKVCYTYSNGDLKPINKDENEIFSCAKGYKLNMRLETDTCADLRPSTSSSTECYKTFIYNCLTAAKKPRLSGSGSVVTGAAKIGTITFTGHPGDENIKPTHYMVTNSKVTPSATDPKWVPFKNDNYRETLQFGAGTYFVWVKDEVNTIGNPIFLVVYDGDISTTLSGLRIANPDGTGNYALTPLGGNGSTAYLDGVTEANVEFMSNTLNRDSLIASGFDLFTTAYELTVDSKQIAVYATLTSDDAKYVEGFEPRTVDLDYGRNEILVKVENKKGKVRTYTFSVTRNDNRESINTLSDLTVSKGKINFDPYVSDYTVSVPKNTKTVSINGTLNSMKAAFVQGYEPRIIPLNNDITSAVLKTMSEAGTIRNYVITFIKTGAEEKDSFDNSTYLSSLTIPETQLLFDKNTTSYSLAVDYEVTSLPVYAFPETNKASVSIIGNVGLKVGTNLVEVMVTNGSKSKLYTVYVNRKQDGLGISEDTTLSSLTVKGYNINFNPEVTDYSLKIKREKTLLLSATPNSDRSEVYMYGNNDLNTFSSIRVKVIAENGNTGMYSLDITKDVYNKKIEITAAIIGGIIIVGGVIIIVVRRRRKQIRDYVGE